MILYTCNTWYDMILLARCPSVVLRQPKSERERLRMKIAATRTGSSTANCHTKNSQTKNL